MFNFNFENKLPVDQYNSTNALQEALLASGILPMPNQLIPTQISADSANQIQASQTQYESPQEQALNQFNTTAMCEMQQNVASLANLPEVQAQFGMA